RVHRLDVEAPGGADAHPLLAARTSGRPRRSSGGETGMRFRLWLELSGFAALALVVAALPRFISDFRARELAIVGIYFIALLGLSILTGYSGQISLGHGAFMAIGGYTTAILSVDGV